MQTKARAGRKPIDLVNAAFITITPIVAIIGTTWYIYWHGVTWLEVANFVLMFLLTGISVTAGYHRYFAHRTYNAGKPLQIFYLVFGAAAVENSVLNWASDHRYHHQFVDQEEDPYNILKGGLYAHMGWIFFKNTRSLHERYRNVPDLLKDPLVRWQDRWYLPLVILVTFAVPTFIGLLQGRPVGGLLWGGFLRVVVTHHTTFFINSIAHLWGTRPYTVDNSARDNWWLGPITFGEGYHNFHHAFQADYRNGHRWYHFDAGKWWIKTMSWLGLASHLRKVPEPLILAAKLKVDMQRVENHLAARGASERMWEKVQWRLEVGRKRLEAATAQYHEAVVHYRHRKDEWSAEVHKQWEEKLAYYKTEFRDAKARWRQTLKAMNRFPQPSAQGILTFTAIVDVLKYRLF